MPDKPMTLSDHLEALLTAFDIAEYVARENDEEYGRLMRAAKPAFRAAHNAMVELAEKKEPSPLPDNAWEVISRLTSELNEANNALAAWMKAEHRLPQVRERLDKVTAERDEAHNALQKIAKVSGRETFDLDHVLNLLYVGSCQDATCGGCHACVQAAKAAIEAAVKEEREACIAICRDLGDNMKVNPYFGMDYIRLSAYYTAMRAIMERSKPKEST